MSKNRSQIDSKFKQRIHICISIRILLIPMKSPFDRGFGNVFLDYDGEEQSANGSDNGIVGFERVVPILELFHFPLPSHHHIRTK